jgi:chloramphenicol O-acetyltransferase
MYKQFTSKGFTFRIMNKPSQESFKNFAKTYQEAVRENIRKGVADNESISVHRKRPSCNRQSNYC